MNRHLLILFLLFALQHCKSSGGVPLNYDREARSLQERINDNNYGFYHDKHPPQLLVPLTIPTRFQSEIELKSGSFVYRLQVAEDGSFRRQAVKPPPDFFAADLEGVLDSLRFKPAWIAHKNFHSEVEVHFVVQYEAY